MAHPYFRNREAWVPQQLIVLVDDDPAQLATIRECLRELGVPILTGTTGAEAWKLIGAERPAVVILDLVPPHTDGSALLRQIREDPETCNTCIPDARDWTSLAGPGRPPDGEPGTCVRRTIDSQRGISNP